MRLLHSLAVLAGLAGVSCEILPNYPLFNKGDAYWINKFNTDIPVPNRWIVQRPWGTAPRHCVATAIDKNYCTPTDIEVFDVYYADCHAPWTVCRCKSVGSSYNINVIADNIGKIPVRARSWVRYYAFWPARAGGVAAYAHGSDIDVFGEYAVSTILFHETNHNLDFWVAGGAQGWYSTGAEWQNVAAQDSCVPTAYSKASYTELFSEITVQVTYEENFGGIPIGTQCMSRMMAKVRDLLRSVVKKVPGDLCIDRIAPSPDVCMGPTARAAGACNNVPDVNQVSKREERRMPTGDGIKYWAARQAPEPLARA